MATQDRELILRAQRGDVAAFEQLVFQYDRQVLNIAASYVNYAEDAKDVYQEVLLRVYRSLRQFQSERVLHMALSDYDERLPNASVAA